MPLITIIVAVFNGAKTLERCIDSVVHQTYPYKELIIMDGGSTDGTVELLKRYDSKIKYWESRPDRGIYHAWNKALDHAEGEWICFIGSDDFFIDPGVLFKIVPKLTDAIMKDCPYAYGQVELYSDKNKRVVEKYNDSWEIIKKRIKRGGFLVHSGSFHHRSLFDKKSRFDERYKISGDRDFLLRSLKFKNAYYLKDVIIRMSMGGLSYDLSAKRELVDEALLIWKDISMTTFPWLLYFSLIKLKLYTIIKSILGERFTIKLADTLRRLRGENPYWDQ
ncbi:MAG: glycosyltransferase family 2 protein [Desulfosalsimonadaceae bacterium]